MMKKRKRKEMSLHDKAVRLLEGGIVEVDNLCVKAFKVDFDLEPCDICEMDSLCHHSIESSMIDLCKECDLLGRANYYLKLV